MEAAVGFALEPPQVALRLFSLPLATLDNLALPFVQLGPPLQARYLDDLGPRGAVDRYCQLGELWVKLKQGSAEFAHAPVAALHSLKERARSSR